MAKQRTITATNEQGYVLTLIIAKAPSMLSSCNKCALAFFDNGKEPECPAHFELKWTDTGEKMYGCTECGEMDRYFKCVDKFVPGQNVVVTNRHNTHYGKGVVEGRRLDPGGNEYYGVNIDGHVYPMDDNQFEDAGE